MPKLYREYKMKVNAHLDFLAHFNVLITFPRILNHVTTYIGIKTSILIMHSRNISSIDEKQ